MSESLYDVFISRMQKKRQCIYRQIKIIYRVVVCSSSSKLPSTTTDDSGGRVGVTKDNDSSALEHFHLYEVGGNIGDES